MEAKQSTLFYLLLYVIKLLFQMNMPQSGSSLNWWRSCTPLRVMLPLLLTSSLMVSVALCDTTSSFSDVLSCKTKAAVKLHLPKKGKVKGKVPSPPMELLSGCTNSPHGVPVIFFGTPPDDSMLITASEGERMSPEDEVSAVLPPSGVTALPESDPELTAMLSRAAASVGLEWSPPLCPESSRLDDWFLGVGWVKESWLQDVSRPKQQTKQLTNKTHK